MKAPVFEYIAAKDLPQALELLQQDKEVRILAGGQSLVPMLNMRFTYPDMLVDINGIKELSYIREDQGLIKIGAMTRQRDLEFSALVEQKLPLLHEAILNVGHRQTRNRGTIGGSLCQLDPSAEIPIVSLAFDARLVAKSKNNERSLGIKDFSQGFMSPGLNDDEMLVEIGFEPWPAGHGYAFSGFSRREGDFAIASVAVMMLLDEQQSIERISVTVGGTASTAFRATKVEELLLGKQPDEALFQEAAEIGAGYEASSDALVPGWYRQHLVGVLMREALDKALGRCGDGND